MNDELQGVTFWYSLITTESEELNGKLVSGHKPFLVNLENDSGHSHEYESEIYIHEVLIQMFFPPIKSLIIHGEMDP